VVDARLRVVSGVYGLDMVSTVALAITNLYRDAIRDGLLDPPPNP